MGFLEYKRRKISALKEALALGKVDEPIVDFLLKINEAEGLGTSSSCAGRVQIIRMRERKDLSTRYYIEHVPEKIDVGFKVALEKALKEGREGLYVKVEPFIYHFIAEDAGTAQKVVESCRRAGVKRCGYQRISHGYLIEVMGTTSASIPLEVADIRADEFVEFAKAMLRKNEKRRKRLEAELMKTFLNTSHD